MYLKDIQKRRVTECTRTQTQSIGLIEVKQTKNKIKTNVISKPNRVL